MSQFSKYFWVTMRSNAAYNISNATDTLIGNWIEENALRDATGHTRRQVPYPHHLDTNTASFPDTMAHARNTVESTRDRVLGKAASDWNELLTSTTQSALRHDDALVTKPSVNGPRTAVRDHKLLIQAQQLIDMEEAEKDNQREQEILALRTQSHSVGTFQPHDTQYLMGKRTQRGRNGAIAATNATFVQKYVKEFPPDMTMGEADSIDKMKLDFAQKPNSVHGDDLTLTRYSHAIQTGKSIGCPMSGSDSTNPFARSTRFTNDIRDASKVHGEAMEPGSLRDERSGMTIHQRSALQKLDIWLNQNVEHRQNVIGLFEAAGRTMLSNGYIDHAAFHRITQSGIEISGSPALALSTKEWTHIFMFFDDRAIGAINIQDVIDRLHSRNRPI
uniref:Uncharacterized protein AlNc14C11G1331 n=1 Tax=Albugo laibachii Nc14 TaxID=890382 RepID=F0W2V1_9STRA|nr:conserved hypothetical protein [Albugo laibachii Nc14]|eukprot:CCA15387.1 conserved hypothetical protein [Albugo laibachii Nc14]